MVLFLVLLAKRSEEGVNGLGAVVGGHDGATDGDALDAGGDDVVDILQRDAADGKGGEGDFGGDLLQEW
jgi:hypothetical protein